MALIFGYVGELYAQGAPEHPDLASLLAVYRCLTTHLAVFGVEIGPAQASTRSSAAPKYAVSPRRPERRPEGPRRRLRPWTGSW